MTRLDRIAYKTTLIGIDEVTWLIARVRELEAVAREAEINDGWCLVCGMAYPDYDHSPECTLAAALENLEAE